MNKEKLIEMHNEYNEAASILWNASQAMVWAIEQAEKGKIPNFVLMVKDHLEKAAIECRNKKYTIPAKYRGLENFFEILPESCLVNLREYWVPETEGIEPCQCNKRKSPFDNMLDSDCVDTDLEKLDLIIKRFMSGSLTAKEYRILGLDTWDSFENSKPEVIGKRFAEILMEIINK